MRKIKIIIMLSIVALVASGCALNKESQEDALSKNNNNSLAVAFGQGQINNQTQDTIQESQNQDEDSMASASLPLLQNDENNAEQPKENQIITLKTNMGDIKIELFLEKMPITAGNFLKLAKSNFYDGSTFHRVIPDFMIQGGDPLSKDNDPNNDGTGGPGYFIEDEFSADYSNTRAMVSMANAGAGTGGSQFFINLGDNSYLDFNKDPAAYKHPVFGEVLEGMDIVDAISAVERGVKDRPLENVIIQDVLVE